MSQHDHNIANAAGATVRADLNSLAQAIAEKNSGGTAPSTTFPFQWWADTTTGLLKIRNAANSAWITVGTLASVNLGLLALAGGTLTGALITAASASGGAGFRLPHGSAPSSPVNGDIWTTSAALLARINGATHTMLRSGGDLGTPSGGDATNLTNKGFTSGTTFDASGGGTSNDWTGLPAGTKVIIIPFSQLSLNGTDDLDVQIGDAGGIETSGYTSTGFQISDTPSVNDVFSTTSFRIRMNNAANLFSGQMILTLVDAATNTWSSSHVLKRATTVMCWGAGDKALSGELTQLRVKTVGTNVFDGGLINVAYSG